MKKKHRFSVSLYALTVTSIVLATLAAVDVYKRQLLVRYLRRGALYILIITFVSGVQPIAFSIIYCPAAHFAPVLFRNGG